MTPSVQMADDPRTRRREARLTAILAEAWALAHRDGLAAISLRDLADRVGLRQPSLYSYFDSKLGLYDLLFADGNRQLLATVWALDLDAESDLDVEPGPERALVQLVEALVRFSSEDIVRHQMLFQRTIPGFEPSEASYALALEFYGFAVEQLAAAGVTDPADIDLFSALVSGLAHQQVANDPGGDRWVRLAAPAVAMFLADVGRRHGPEAAGKTPTSAKTTKAAPTKTATSATTTKGARS